VNNPQHPNDQPQPGYPPMAVPAPKKKGKAGKVFMLGCLLPLGLLVLVVILVVAFSAGGSKTPAPTGVPVGNDPTTAAQKASAQPAQPAQHTIVYSVTGSGKASSITYVTDGMTSQNQESDVALPWTKTLTLPTGEAFQMVSILAQGNGKGTIKVTITVDGKLYKEASATGYGIASANGNIGSLG
jgi:hypothetical protein